MKKLLLIALALLMILSLIACDTAGPAKDTDTTDPVDSSSAEPDESSSEPADSSSEPDDSSSTPSDDDPATPTDPSVFTEVDETVYVYGTNELHVRVSYTTESESVGQMKEGESVKRTGYNEKWSRIEYNGETRYASSAYLTTVAPFEYTDKLETVYVNTEFLNLRAKASPESDIVVSLKYGDAVERTGVSKTKDEQGNEWSRLLYNGQVCYANSLYLSASLTTSDTLTFTAKKDTVYTTAASVNLRKDASLAETSTIIVSLEYGTRLERTGIASAPDADGITWSRVLYNGEVAYISSGYISTTAPISFTAINTTMYVNGDSKLRAIPVYPTGAELLVIPKGAEIKCLAKATKADAEGITWYKVTYNEITGYVSAKFLLAEKPAE